MSKPVPFLFTLLVFLPFSPVQAGLTQAELENVRVSVTPILLDAVEGLEAQELICLTPEWEAVDPELHKRILNLQQAAPEAFEIPGKGNPNLCFDPAKIPDSSRDELIAILNRMSQLSGGEIAVPIELSEEQVDLLRNEDRPMGRKLLRSSFLIQGTQAVGMGALLMLPSSVTKWPENPLKHAGKNLRRAWTTPPVWDKDDWAINYIGHPYSGALYYNALRSQGASPLASFLFSTAQSIFWEYTVEATAEQPSIQDLLFTSTIGSVYGELAHRATIGMSRSGGRFTTVEKIVVTILNPAYVINNGFRKKHARPGPVF